MYKIELHAHIMEQSSDSKISAEQYIKLLEEKEYQTFVTTDHYLSSELNKTNGNGLLEKNRNWLGGYYACKEAAKGTNINVLLGMEYTLEYHDHHMDILLYGITEELLTKGIIRPYFTIDELKELCHQYGILMIQAHPERYGHHRLPAYDVDGYEIMNTKIRDKYVHGYNEMIQMYVKDKPGIICTGGSDSHVVTDVGKGGIITHTKINTIDDLKDALMEKKYEVIFLKEDQ